MNTDHSFEGQRIILAISGFALLLISLCIAVSVGAVSVPASTVWGILANKVSPDLFAPIWSQGREAIVWEIQFPRALLAMMVGSGLAIVGAALQAVTRNPLADPHTWYLIWRSFLEQSLHSCTQDFFLGFSPSLF